MKKKEQTRNEMFLEQLDDLDKEFKELQTDVLLGDAAYANSSFVIGCIKRVIKLVVAVISKKERKLFFSTDVNMSGKDVVDFYRSRFQIEFTFRDAHMYTGLGHCEARSAVKLNFAINASLCTINVMREYIAQENLDISIGQLKEIITRLSMFKLFSDRLGMDYKEIINRVGLSSIIDPQGLVA